MTLPTDIPPNTRLGIPENPIQPWLIKAFRALIAERTGFIVNGPDVAALCENILERTAALQLPFPEAYFQKLVEPEASSREEWGHLSERLTNTESFFFRDAGQFLVLREHLLPALIERNRAEKKLRICSAGCSTGEEPYSIAIVLHELLPDIATWDVQIFGLDINPGAIAHAQAGIYRPWAFRRTPASQQDTYFRKVNEHYHLHPAIKQLVSFYPVNLVNDTLPFGTSTHGMSEPCLDHLDLIICRNVFIYFETDAIAKVINKFHQVLKPQGYLMTGHSELYDQNTTQFQIKAFPQSLIFQKPKAPTATPNAKAEAALLSETTPNALAFNAQEINLPTPHRSADSVDTPLQIVHTLLKEQNFQQALKQAKIALTHQPEEPEILCLLAQIHIALSQWAQAIDYCQRAVEVEHDDVKAHHILAQIFAAQGDLATAKRTLRKILYLDPDNVSAYLELSQLYQQEGNLKKSQLMRHSAFEIFREQQSFTADEPSR